MPLYDFRCRTCRHEFEVLVRPQDQHTPECPSCQGRDLEKLLSSFAVTSTERKKTAAAVKVKKDAVTGRRDSIAMDKEIEAHRKEDF